MTVIQTTTFGDLQEGDLFFFPTMDAQAVVMVRTAYFTQHINPSAMVYRIVIEAKSSK